MLGLGKKFFGTKHDRQLKKLRPLVAHINSLEADLEKLSYEALTGKTAEFKTRLENGATLDDLLPEAFAVVRETSRRVLGMRHYDVQMLGGTILHQGKVAEMRTGEGKTLSATLPMYLNALEGKGAHLVTVNAYLAGRDVEWMGQVYRALGLSTGLIVHGKSNRERRAAYKADITYGTNSEFGFDYLRDNMKLKLEDMAQRGHRYAIIDEVDSILIDEARTPLIISGPTDDSLGMYYEVDRVMPRMVRDVDYEVDEKQRAVSLSDEGIDKVEKLLGIENIYSPGNIGLLHHVNQALRAHALYKRDADYVVKDGKIVIVDTFTGRQLPGRRWSDGLHQAVEAKEQVSIQSENQTLATITYQKYFLKYDKLAGMTGTADTEATEFKEIYELDVTVVPTNLPLVRNDFEDVIYKDEGSKFRAVAREIKEMYDQGRPVLVGTLSVEKSEKLSLLLRRADIPHEILNAKQHAREALIVAQAGAPRSVTISTNMAGRGTDILLGGNPEFLAQREVGPHVPEAEDEETYNARLEAALAKTTKDCADAKAAVLEAGGLHIIGTERHESRRIDNQLRGRAGRQGDPGSSRFFLCLDDDLLRIFGSERMTNMMERMGLEEDVPLEHRWLTKAVENAQTKVEAHHFNIRKNLLEYDEVMSQQRDAVYGLRRRLLGDEDTRTLLLEMAEDVCEDILDDFWADRLGTEVIDRDAMNKALQQQFSIELEVDAGEVEGKKDPVIDRLFGEIESFFEEKEKLIPDDRLRAFEREMFLRVIDTRWKNHLAAMDHLRTGIGLQGYGQRNPLLEYKKEGFRMYRTMEALRDQDTVQRVFEQLSKRTLTEEEVQALVAEREQRAKALASGGAARPQPGAAAAGVAGGAAGASSAEQEIPVVGRNEPCPCGSGRKYKKCHGAAGRA